MSTYRFTKSLAFATAALIGSAANAALVAYFPIDSATDSSNFIDDIIDDPTHGVANGTTANNNGSIIFDAFRGGDVLSTVEGHRYAAGTQDIDLNEGFTWSLWVKVNSSNIADSGGDSIIGTRNGSPWHKMDLTTIQNWNGNVPGAGSYATLADDTWHHLAYVGDANNRRLYKDGVMIAQDLNFTIATFNGVMEIGGSSKFNEDVTGLYDDIAIWNERLSEEDIVALAGGADPQNIPEPGSLALLAIGGSLMVRRRR